MTTLAIDIGGTKIAAAVCDENDSIIQRWRVPTPMDADAINQHIAEVYREAVAAGHTDIEAIGIPRATFDELMAMSPDFRGFVMRAWSRRVTDLLSLIDDIAFQRIDLRLATRLLAMAEGDTVHATHQQLAAELGSAREVISRTLSEFQRRGWIEQARGEVRLMDRPALEKLTREPEV